MPCMICNPSCGLCTPPRRRVVHCPECGDVNLLEKHEIFGDERKFCKKCNAELTQIMRVEPVSCCYSGLMCAYPCGKHRDDSRDTYLSCTNNTPLDYVPPKDAKKPRAKMINPDAKIKIPPVTK